MLSGADASNIFSNRDEHIPVASIKKLIGKSSGFHQEYLEKKPLAAS
jgi:hypothetical protein